MRVPKKAVVFDLYGTLIDILTDEQDPQIYAVLSRYLSYHVVRISPEVLRKSFFESVRGQLAKSGEPYPEVDVFKVFHDIMHRCGRRRYPRCVVSDTAMLFRALSRKRFGAFDGIYDALTSLSGDYRLAVVSDAQWVFTEPEMAMLGLPRFFDAIVLSSRYGYKKPDPRLFHTALRKIGVRPENAVYIGDNPEKDLAGAGRAGLKCLLFRAQDVSVEGYRAHGRFSDYSELEGMLKAVMA